MLNVVKKVDDKTIDGLFSIYAESMGNMRDNFADEHEMRTAYASFLKEFVSDPKHMIIVENVNGQWVSALRALETTTGHWFLEAVETKPSQRKKGYGKDMLHHTIDYLNRIGMTEITCTISKNNFKSQELHSKCGFIPTDELPVNPWGQWEEGTIMFRWSQEQIQFTSQGQ